MGVFNPQPKSVTIKKTKNPLRRTAIKKKFKVTGEKDLFHEVLDNLSDSEECKCFVCGTPIALVMPHNFAHVLSKKQYPRMRLHSDNIVLLCHKIIADKNGQGCHYAYDMTPHSNLKGEGWERLFELKENLKQLYRRL